MPFPLLAGAAGAAAGGGGGMSLGSILTGGGYGLQALSGLFDDSDKKQAKAAENIARDDRQQRQDELLIELILASLENARQNELDLRTDQQRKAELGVRLPMAQGRLQAARSPLDKPFSGTAALAEANARGRVAQGGELEPLIARDMPTFIEMRQQAQAATAGLNVEQQFVPGAVARPTDLIGEVAQREPEIVAEARNRRKDAFSTQELTELIRLQQSGATPEEIAAARKRFGEGTVGF